MHTAAINRTARSDAARGAESGLLVEGAVSAPAAPAVELAGRESDVAAS